MSAKQKRIVSILAFLNGAVILTLIFLVTQAYHARSIGLVTPGGGNSSARSSTPVQDTWTIASEAPSSLAVTRPPTSSTDNQSPEPLSSESTQCQWMAAQMMADAGLNGAVRRIESGIDFRVMHALTSTQTIDGAAQCIWTLFDVVASLTEAGHCDGVVDVAVTISVTGPRDETTIEAYVMLSDLMDFHRQVLNEGEFIDRVDYSVTPVQAQSTP